VVVKQETMLADTAVPRHVQELHRSQDLVWRRHRDTMQRYFSGKGLPKVVWSTKVKIQEKGFRNQVQNELQVGEAKYITEDQVGNGAQACITDFGGTAIDAQFPDDALWELSSTKLWRYYEGGRSWDQLSWIPGGYLRIQVTRFATKLRTPVANIILEFGNLTFTAEEVAMPRCKCYFHASYQIPILTCVSALGTTTQTLKAHLVDHVHSGEFIVSFKFYQGGHLLVSFPALPLITMDDDCDFTLAASKVIEFAGVYMGEVE
jgi:hypothetical protein